jgi:hypothetical protein
MGELSKISYPRPKIVCLVYRSVAYLEFINKQLAEQGVPYLIIANDATPEVMRRLQAGDIPYLEYHDPKPDSYYMNRVYRAYNFGGMEAAKSFDVIVFVNSDMLFAKNWLENLLKRDLSALLPCSRLVESGKMSSGRHGISKDFGRAPKSVWTNKDLFYEYADDISRPVIAPGGLFMPCAIRSDVFRDSGGYPEGNIYLDGPGCVHTPFVESGDRFYFRRLNDEFGLKHITVFDSIVYHIQEGEKDSANEE